MANLQAKNVFIDTESFEAMNLNFEHTMFKELVRFAQVEFVKVFLTTVTVSEITGHIAERIHDALCSSYPHTGIEAHKQHTPFLRNVILEAHYPIRCVNDSAVIEGADQTSSACVS